MSQEQNKDMNQYFYRASAADFTKIPGSPIAYWPSSKTFDVFLESGKLSDTVTTAYGLITMDNSRFVRDWTEVGLRSISYFNKETDSWVPFNNGGCFRRWYGNNDNVVRWLNNGEAIKQLAIKKNGSVTRTVVGQGYYFRPGMTWNAISSGNICIRYFGEGFIFSNASMCAFGESLAMELTGALLNSKVGLHFLNILAPTVNFGASQVALVPALSDQSIALREVQVKPLLGLSKIDWDSYETSWDFTGPPLLLHIHQQPTIEACYRKLRSHWREMALDMQRLEQENNRIFIDAYGLQDELTPEVPLNEITLTCSPHYRYGGDKSEQELEALLLADTMRELVSYAVGCMMGRYSLDKPGLILASQGETLQDYLHQIPSPRFAPDDDAILPLTDQEWFADDATNRFREFVRVVWGDEHLSGNLAFVAESLGLHAIKPKKGEDSLDTIRRYLSTQFFKDHLRTYKKRPIYWLFSSGRHKAFECLVYLHRYNEGTLARMRTEYVIPLTAKLNAYASKLEKDIDASSITAEKKALEKQLATLHNQQAELATFDEKLRHYADQRIRLDLDDGVKVNYGKFGDLVAEVNAITGGTDE